MQSRPFSKLPVIGILTVCLFYCRQGRIDAGIFAGECIAGVAGRRELRSRHCSCSVTEPGLQFLSVHFW